MDVVYDPKLAEWLTTHWDQTLDWDNANTRKLGKHATTVEKVESILDGTFILGGRIIPPDGTEWNEERFILYGRADDGRKFTIIWTIRGNKIRPISCRRMQTNEIKIYEQRVK